VFAVVFFHRIYESVELGNASFDHQPPSKLVAPVFEPLYSTPSPPPRAEYGQMICRPCQMIMCAFDAAAEARDATLAFRMTFDDQLRRSFDTLTDVLRDDVVRRVQAVVDELAASARAERDGVVVEPLVEVERGGSDPNAASRALVEAVRSIGAERSLSGILDTLVKSAGSDAARVGVVLIRGGCAYGWRSVGFDPPLDKAEPLDLSLNQAGIIADAARTSTGTYGDGTGGLAPSFAALPPGRRCFAAPLALCGEVVAVLYADQGLTGPDLREPQGATIEVLTRHAARCLEATTAFRVARALAEHADRGVLATPTDGTDAAADGDVAARRYARLLVSEIKLYHEAAVVDGRRERDLAARLSGEMARARVLYEQRVPPQVRQRADYFRDELVRTLANGDASLLGS
jgi:hypothetical protein